MYRIAICYNQDQIINEISKTLYEIAPKFKVEIQVFTYTDVNELLNSHIRYNLIFLGIKLKGVNGINLAMEIRKTDPQVQIVYVTKYLSYLREAYKIHAFDYIQRPFKKEDISRVLEDYLKFVNFIKEDVIKFRQLNGREVLLYADNIIYISCGTKKREVIVITKDKDYTCKGVISEIYSELNNFDFFIPHRSHIVNLSQIKTYIKNEKIFMINDDEIPLAKGRSKEFEIKYKRKMNEYNYEQNNPALV